MTNDSLLSLDRTKSTFYIGLDLSAAFDTLDHELLLSILETGLAFKDKVLSFVNSYLSSRSRKVLIVVNNRCQKYKTLFLKDLLEPVIFSC